MKTIFDNVKALAKERGMSVQEVMKAADLSLNVAYKWRPTPSNPTAVTPTRDTLARVAEVLAVDIDVLTKDTSVSDLHLHAPGPIGLPFAFKYEGLWYQVKFMPIIDSIYVARYSNSITLIDQKLLSRPYFIQMSQISSSPVYIAVLDYLFGRGFPTRFTWAPRPRRTDLSEVNSGLNFKTLKTLTDPLKYFLFLGDLNIPFVGRARDILDIYDKSSEFEFKKGSTPESVSDFAANILKTMYLSTTPLIELDDLMSGKGTLEWRNFAIKVLSDAMNVDYSDYFDISDDYLPALNFRKWLAAVDVTSTYFMAKGIPVTKVTTDDIPSQNIQLLENVGSMVQKEVLKKNIKGFYLQVLSSFIRDDAVSDEDVRDMLRMIGARHPTDEFIHTNR
jgi:transcriptional regulator with XRE-family HTH domain